MLTNDVANYEMWQLIIGMVDGWHSSPGGLNNFSHIGLDSPKNSFTFVYLVNESNSTISLDSNIKQVEFKHNNVFMINLVSMQLD